MEYFDIINEQDEVIGQASRVDCHNNPALLHRTIHFTLINRSTKEVLVTVRNPKLKYDGGKVCFMGEHIKTGESYTAAVIRGVSEELGYKPTSFHESAMNIFAYAKQRELVRFYLVDWHNEPINPDKNEISKVEWISIDLLTAHPRDYSEMTRYWINHVDWKAVNSPR